VAADDLNSPLGMDERKKRRLPSPVPVIASAVGAIFAIGIAWTALIDNPLGGEPVAVVAIDRTKPQAGKARQNDAAAQSNAQQSAPPVGKAEPGTGASGQASPPPSGPLIIKVPQRGAPPPLMGSDTPIAEASKYGLVPKISSDGRKPSDIFAKTSVAEAEDKRPKIAILIGGLGIGREATNQVFDRLPRTITLGFPPYGDNLEQWVARAREDGHEIMLQVPMEPFDYPDNDPGPQTLLTSASSEQNLDRLYWHLSRFQGYAGLANFMGARFVATDAAMQPIVREAGKRGLAWFDDGTAPRSVAGTIAQGQAMPFAKADLTIDVVPTAVEIDRALAQLETVARQRGVAVGVASALPITIDRIASWTKLLEGRGILLVPLTTAMHKSKSS
jgi:polysaccharide deacetylase 2 family uncharacterized protein YibQ